MCKLCVCGEEWKEKLVDGCLVMVLIVNEWWEIDDK